jgi:hypothetical protein
MIKKIRTKVDIKIKSNQIKFYDIKLKKKIRKIILKKYMAIKRLSIKFDIINK